MRPYQHFSKASPRSSEFKRGTRFTVRGNSWLKILLAAALAWLLWLLTPASLEASQNPWPELKSDAEYSYGQVMRFLLEASSSSPISKVTLNVQALEIPNTLTAELDIAPNEDISIAHDVDLTQVRLAPFTTVTYWWVLENEAGETTESDRQTLEYIDDQYTWNHEALDGIQIRWSAQDPAEGRAAEEAVQNSLPQIEALIPIARPDPLKIFIYPSAADLQAGLRLTGRDWIGAHARPELGVILVAADGTSGGPTDLTQSIAHELAHLYMYKATGNGYENVPRWLDEGIASLVEGPIADSNYAARLEEAVAAGETIPLSELCYSLPSSGDDPFLAYAQSASFVDYIQSEFGDQALQHMIAEIADRADCQSAPIRVLDKTLAELNAEWLEQQMPQTFLQRLWQNGRVWLIIIAAGFVLAGLLTRLPKRTNR